MQREIKKQLLSDMGIGTKSQQALKSLQEAAKIKCRQKTREKKQAEEMRLFSLKQQKKKEKHRGIDKEPPKKFRQG